MKFPKIDWINHTVGFITTVIGIFIGLTLDSNLKDHEMEQRLSDFRGLLNEEINSNFERLEYFATVSSLHHDQLKFLIDKNITDSVIQCHQSELDSLQVLWRASPFISEARKVGDNKYRIKYVIKIFETAPLSTVWESFKNTDLVNNMSGNEITEQRSSSKQV